MFEAIAPQKADSILSLMAEFKKDDRPNKIDLGIGVYRNEDGITPIMQAVTLAEQRLLNEETTKAYQGLAGDELFNQALQSMLLADTDALKRTATLHTPGASGALRILADLIATTRPNATVWIGNPSYINHRPIMERAGLKVEEYPYLNEQTKMADETSMLNQLAKLGADDVVLLHGCCHNPSGADISFETWQAITDLANTRGFLPFVDIAYQGMGDSLDIDAKGLRFLADRVDEVLISTSCSKNFGLYRERTGAAMIVSSDAHQALNIRGKMCDIARGYYTMPPAHGAAIVRTILTDAELQQMWTNELTQMTDRVNGLRASLVSEFQNKLQSNRFDYFGQHKGMFSLTGIHESAIQKLKADFGIYIVSGGRVNVAGLKQSDIPVLVDAFIKTNA